MKTNENLLSFSSVLNQLHIYYTKKFDKMQYENAYKIDRTKF